MYRNSLLCTFLLFLCFHAFKGVGQQTLVKGVSIAEDSLPPHPSAILDVRSLNKGMLIARMTYDEMVAFGDKNPPAGTTVHVEVAPDANWQQQQRRGLYYWNANTWKKLEVQRIQYPVGSILFYSLTGQENPSQLFDSNGKGLSGTKMAGWAICNGNHGTPDLRGRFVVGADGNDNDYNVGGKTGGITILHGKGPNPTLTSNNIRHHKHKVDFSFMDRVRIDHDHEFVEDPHRHEFNVTNKGSGNSHRRREGDSMDEQTTVMVRKRKNRRGLRRNNPAYEELPGHPVIQSRRTVLKVGESPISVNNATIGEAVQETGGGEPIDNAPPFYVALYIMRVEQGTAVSQPGQGNVEIPVPLSTSSGTCN
ncbi:hypothetical protein RCC89_05000 [Cytophagaceae bacterium ABcell3]|nr:hypothetical protein RCC89_05000 [Cytophagaceae bacterium ABcell3]